MKRSEPKEENIFAEGIKGWKWMFSKVAPKKKEDTAQDQQAQLQQANTMQ